MAGLFNLDGSFDRMPGFEGVDDFPAESDNLKESTSRLEWLYLYGH